MLAATQLGDIRQDLINYLGPFIGNDKVGRAYDTAMAKIRSEAESGARTGVTKEVPTIEARVRAEATKAVRPMVIGSLAASGVAGALALIAIIAAKRKRKAG